MESPAWEHTFCNVDDGTHSAQAIAVQEGRVVVTGHTTNENGNQHFLVRAIDAVTGDFPWQDLFDVNGGNDTGLAITAAQERICVAGTVVNESGDQDFVVRAYTASNGALLWEKQLDKAGGRDSALSIAAGASQVFVAGFVNNGSNADFMVRAYDFVSGTLEWEDQFDRAGDNDQAVDIAVLGDHVIAVGLGADDEGTVAVDTGIIHRSNFPNGANCWQGGCCWLKRTCGERDAVSEARSKWIQY